MDAISIHEVFERGHKPPPWKMWRVGLTYQQPCSPSPVGPSSPHRRCQPSPGPYEPRDLGVRPSLPVPRVYIKKHFESAGMRFCITQKAFFKAHTWNTFWVLSFFFLSEFQWEMKLCQYPACWILLYWTVKQAATCSEQQYLGWSNEKNFLIALCVAAYMQN